MLSYTGLINGTAITGAIAVAILGQQFRDPGVDDLTVGSVISVYSASQFTVVDHRNNRTCTIALHRAEGYDVHRLEPGDCGRMPAQLASARTWQDTPAGDVRITDHTGKVLMKLGVSDGFAWEVVEPQDLALSFEAF